MRRGGLVPLELIEGERELSAHTRLFSRKTAAWTAAATVSLCMQFFRVVFTVFSQRFHSFFSTFSQFFFKVLKKGGEPVTMG